MPLLSYSMNQVGHLLIKQHYPNSII